MAKRMAKKKIGLLPISAPSISHILDSEMSLPEKRRKVLEELGARKPKKKYKTVEDRKAAAKERAGVRRAEKIKILGKYGLAPKKAGPKLTKEEKREKRSNKGKVKREFIREMARQNPDLAKKFGIDPTRFRKQQGD